MAKARSSNTLGYGCLTLFTIPFAAVGAGMGVWLACTVYTWLDARSWVATPAQITRAELKVRRGNKSSTYEVTADYVYEYGGQRHTGSRVSLSRGSDNIGSFHKKAFEELDACRKAGRPRTCYVNPARPEEAVLYRDLYWDLLTFQSIFVLAFGGVGFGLMTAAFLGWRQERGDAARAAANPNTPWLAKAEWAAGRITSSSRKTMIGTSILALVWNTVALPLWFVVPGEVMKGNLFALLGMIIPAIGLAIAAGAVVARRRWRKFGESAFRMASVPGVVGGQLAGVIEISTKVQPDDGFHLTLNCIRRVTRGSGKSRSTTEESVWDDEQIVAKDLLDAAAEHTAIPVVFQIPYDCRPTDEIVSDDETVWRLKATAAVPGLDYAATFEVPVFQTADSDPEFVPDDRAASEYAAPADPDRDLREAGVRKSVSPMGDGVQFVFPMGRNTINNAFMTIFATIWTGAIVFMLRPGVPIFFPIVFGLADVVMLLLLADLWFYRSVVDVSPRGMTIAGGLFGLGRPRSIAPAEIQRLDTERGMSSGTRTYYNLVLLATDGRRLKIGKRLPGHRLATAVLGQLEAALGRKK